MATTAKEWKKNTEKHYELKVPSGNTCLVRRPGPQMLLQGGSIPNSLLGVVMPLLEEADATKKKGEDAPDMENSLAELQKAVLDDPEKIQDMFTMVDNIAVQCVVAPMLTPVPEAGTERDEDLLYVDDVDFEDKIVIFNYALGGTADLERFRSGTEALVVAGQAGSEVPQPTE